MDGFSPLASPRHRNKYLYDQSGSLNDGPDYLLSQTYQEFVN